MAKKKRRLCGGSAGNTRRLKRLQWYMCTFGGQECLQHDTCFPSRFPWSKLGTGMDQQHSIGQNLFLDQMHCYSHLNITIPQCCSLRVLGRDTAFLRSYLVVDFDCNWISHAQRCLFATHHSLFTKIRPHSQVRDPDDDRAQVAFEIACAS